jgi:1-aminocyclopropane-1-carboxylate deaminase/D-cysteine desulfhydrase-like pyridoxal-dependent ACC family enzyme
VLPLRLPSPLTRLDDERMERHGITLLLKRDDLIHPEIPGNKWRKLKYTLAAAREAGATTLLTFGGAYSNHIRATAAAGRRFGFRTIGVIRGEEHRPLNPSLAHAVSRGMSLTYLDRDAYRRKTTDAVLDPLRERFGDFFLIPEGGSCATAVRGCAELVAEVDVEFDVMCCACGTGGTLAGIATGLAPGQRAVGFSALRGGEFLVDEVARLQTEAVGAVSENWSVDTEFHFGGFARRKPELDAFLADFDRRHGVTLDRVYVAKMMYGVYALAERGYFPFNTTVVAVVTG